MRSMFAGCSNLASLDVSKFDTSELEMASGMFRGCKNLKTIYCQDNRDVWVPRTAEEKFEKEEHLVEMLRAGKTTLEISR